MCGFRHHSPCFVILFTILALSVTGCESGSVNYSGKSDADWEYLGNPSAPGKYNDAVVLDSGTVLAAAGGGIQVSRDNGITWKQVTVNNYGMGPILLLKLHSGHALCATKDGKIYKSVDDGYTWELAFDSIHNSIVFDLVQIPDGRIFASIGQVGTIVSSDYGESWNNLGREPGVSHFAFNANNAVYGRGIFGIYKLNADGETWDEVISDLPIPQVRVIAIDSSEQLFAGTQDGKIISATPGVEGFTEHYIGDEDYRIGFLWIDSKNEIFALDRQSVLLRSTDNGLTWDKTDFENSISLVRSDSFERLVAVGSYLLVSDYDGIKWDCLGSETRPVLSVAALNEGVVFAGTEGIGLYRSSPLGFWVRKYINLLGGISGITRIYSYDETELFAGTLAWGVIRSLTGGENWMNMSLSSETKASDMTYALENTFYTVQRANIWFWYKIGERWRGLGNSIHPGNVNCIESDENGFLIAGTDFGLYILQEHNGEWADIGQDVFPGSIQELCVTDQGNCFIATSNNIYVSYDAYDSWELIHEEFGESEDVVIRMADIPGAGVLISFKGIGILLFDESDGTSLSIVDGLPDIQINDVCSDPSGKVYVGTDSGVYGYSRRIR